MRVLLLFSALAAFCLSEVLELDTTECYSYRVKFDVTNNGDESLGNFLLEIPNSYFENGERLVYDDSCSDIEFKTSNEEDAWASKVNHWLESPCLVGDYLNTWIEATIDVGETLTLYMYFHCEETVEQTEKEWSGGFFVHPNVDSCSANDGWESFPDMNGYFPKGGDLNLPEEQFGVTTGDAYETFHNHSLSSNQFFGKNSLPENNLIPRENYPKDAPLTTEIIDQIYHYHYLGLQWVEHNDLPLHTKVLYCKGEKYGLSTGMLLFFDNETDVSSMVDTSISRISEHYGSFLLGHSEFESQSGSLGHVHNETFESAVTGKGLTDIWYDPPYTVFESMNPRHTHPVQVSTEMTAEDALLPHVSVPVFQYVPDSNDDPLSKRVVTIASKLPPLGWQQYDTLTGKFLKVAGTDNKWEAAGSTIHDHPFNLDFQSGENYGDNHMVYYNECNDTMFNCMTNWVHAPTLMDHTHGSDNPIEDEAPAEVSWPSFYVQYYQRMDMSTVSVTMSDPFSIIICSNGFFNSILDCVVCPAGSFCTGGVLELCAEGTTSDEGSSSCTLCPVGSFCTEGLMFECPIATTSIEGSSSCSPCPAGSYCTGGLMTECPDGTISIEGSSTCISCSSGYTPNQLKNNCISLESDDNDNNNDDNNDDDDDSQSNSTTLTVVSISAAVVAVAAVVIAVFVGIFVGLKLKNKGTKQTDKEIEVVLEDQKLEEKEKESQKKSTPAQEKEKEGEKLDQKKDEKDESEDEDEEKDGDKSESGESDESDKDGSEDSDSEDTDESEDDD